MKKFLTTMLVGSMCLATACSTSTPIETTEDTTVENITIEAESETTVVESEVPDEIDETAEDGEYLWELTNLSATDIYDIIIATIHFEMADNSNDTVNNFLAATPFEVEDASIWNGVAEVPLADVDLDCCRYFSLLNYTDDNGNVISNPDMSIAMGFTFVDRAKAEELFELLGNYYFEHYTDRVTPDTEYYMTRDLDDGGWFLETPGGGGMYSLALFEEDGVYKLSVTLDIGLMEQYGIEI